MIMIYILTDVWHSCSVKKIGDINLTKIIIEFGKQLTSRKEA